VINLMDALRQSVQGKRGNTHARRRQTAKKRRAASRHKKAA
jgi:non-homologous end joining protein Ku